MGVLILKRRSGLYFNPIKVSINNTWLTVKYGGVNELILPEGKYEIKGEDDFASKGKANVEISDSEITEVVIGTIIPNILVLICIGIMTATFVLTLLSIISYSTFGVILITIVAPVFLVTFFKRNSYIKFKTSE